MSNSRQIIFEWVTTTAQQAPVSTRIKLYRALADFTGDSKETSHLNSLADDLEKADARAREFAFQLSLRRKP